MSGINKFPPPPRALYDEELNRLAHRLEGIEAVNAGLMTSNLLATPRPNAKNTSMMLQIVVLLLSLIAVQAFMPASSSKGAKLMRLKVDLF